MLYLLNVLKDRVEHAQDVSQGHAKRVHRCLCSTQNKIRIVKRSNYKCMNHILQTFHAQDASQGHAKRVHR